MQTKEIQATAAGEETDLRTGPVRRSRRRMGMLGGVAAVGLVAATLQIGSGHGGDAPTAPSPAPMITAPAIPGGDGMGGVDG